MRAVAPPPPTRRRFGLVWHELDYVVEKITYWLYERRDRKAAARYHERLKGLVRRIGQNRVAIIGNLARALLAEMEGDTRGAIRHRERQLKAIERYFVRHTDRRWEDKLVLYSERSYVLYGRLGELYAESGQLDRGILALERYKRLCREHRVRFHNEPVLRGLRRRKSHESNKSNT